jgi:hypothetical protein
MVKTTIVKGKVLMQNGELTTLDENQITSRAGELSAQVWKRYEEQF